MTLSFVRVGAAVLAGCLVVAGSAAMAQPRRPAARPFAPHPQAGAPGQPPGPTHVNLVGIQPTWTKVCGHDKQANRDICYTTRDFGTGPGKPPALALAVYDVKGQDERIVRLLLPVGLLLKPGFRFAVDKGAAMGGDFDICFPNGCFAESRVNGKTIEQMKRGKSLAVDVKNQANAEVTFVVPLEGFGKAFDGPPINPKLLQQQQAKQEALQQQMQKRAEEERQRLESAPGSTPAPAGGAPGHLTLPTLPGQ